MTRPPLQNRVTPDGEIRSHPARGALMGNRGGVLHRADQTLGQKRWASKQWIHCVLSFKNRQRRVMAPGRYTELFFHDEPVALAAGHRPCAECQRARYKAFTAAWEAAFGPGLDGSAPRAPQIDAALHSARLTRPDGPRSPAQKRVFDADWRDLPDGIFTCWNGGPALLWQGALHPWSFTGYAAPLSRPVIGRASVLTPGPTVAALREGYVPAAPLGVYPA